MPQKPAAKTAPKSAAAKSAPKTPPGKPAAQSPDRAPAAAHPAASAAQSPVRPLHPAGKSAAGPASGSLASAGSGALAVGRKQGESLALLSGLVCAMVTLLVGAAMRSPMAVLQAGTAFGLGYLLAGAALGAWNQAAKACPAPALAPIRPSKEAHP